MIKWGESSSDSGIERARCLWLRAKERETTWDTAEATAVIDAATITTADTDAATITTGDTDPATTTTGDTDAATTTTADTVVENREG